MPIANLKRSISSVMATALFLSGAGIALADDLPEERFTMARMAIEEAQEVDADVSASGELTLAEQKLQQAIEQDDKGHEEAAARLLQQSMLHAELAEVEGLQAQADVSFTELNAALSSLEAEIRRP
jgi:hypothetical protein